MNYIFSKVFFTHFGEKKEIVLLIPLYFAFDKP